VRKLIVVPALCMIMACGESPMAPDTLDLKPAFALEVRPITTSVWETWTIDGFAGCSNHTFVDGTLRVHLVTSTMELADGSVVIKQEMNSAGGKLLEANGDEYVFGQNATFIQDMLISGAYEVFSTTGVRLISKGSATNQFVVVDLAIEWDLTTLTVTPTVTLRCVGGGA
jgi:hypothetical protein